MSRLTREQVVRAYRDRLGLSEQMLELNFEVLPCRCGSACCCGWRLLLKDPARNETSVATWRPVEPDETPWRMPQ